ncbi:hypothetical protein OH77DRAFT_1427340, partial [Trametes cingulata]
MFGTIHDTLFSAVDTYSAAIACKAYVLLRSSWKGHSIHRAWRYKTWRKPPSRTSHALLILDHPHANPKGFYTSGFALSLRHDAEYAMMSVTHDARDLPMMICFVQDVREPEEQSIPRILNVEDVLHEELFAPAEHFTDTTEPVMGRKFYRVVNFGPPTEVEPMAVLRSPQGSDIFLSADYDSDGDESGDSDDVDDVSPPFIPPVLGVRTSLPRCSESCVLPSCPAVERVLPRQEFFLGEVYYLDGLGELPRVPDEAWRSILASSPFTFLEVFQDPPWEELDDYWKEEVENLCTVEEMLLGMDGVLESADDPHPPSVRRGCSDSSSEVAEDSDEDTVLEEHFAAGDKLYARRFSTDSGCGTSVADSCFGVDGTVL